MTNKELQEILKQYPEDIEISVVRTLGKTPILCSGPIVKKMLDVLVIE